MRVEFAVSELGVLEVLTFLNLSTIFTMITVTIKLSIIVTANTVQFSLDFNKNLFNSNLQFNSVNSHSPSFLA